MRVGIKNIILIGLCLGLLFLYYKYKTSQAALDNAIINNKAYQEEIALVQRDNLQFNLDINTLKAMNDSVSLKLKQSIQKSRIKEKRIEQLIHINNTLQRKDTIFINNIDTIFIPNLNVDTVIGDEYYNLRLQLQYPNKIITTPTFINELNVITHTSREYVKPRKKFWIQRIFQKRHTVVRGIIINDNPYVIQSNNRFIKIIK